VAVVTGATGAIGRAIASRLISSGATVYAIGRTRETLDELCRTTEWPLQRLHPCAVDLGDEDDVERFGRRALVREGRIEVLVHAAGAIALDDFADASVSDFDRQYRVNVRAPFRLTQMLLPQLIAAGGQVVFLNSTAGLRVSRKAALYGATKHAVRALADSLRDEVNQSGVRVMSVFLGRTASPMQAGVHRDEGRPYDPGKLLQPEDVASVVMNALELPRTAEVTDVCIRPFVKSY
jgi:NADP-dependent 3-hydroxy acid dehydrogenase YdfG